MVQTIIDITALFCWSLLIVVACVSIGFSGWAFFGEIARALQ